MEQNVEVADKLEKYGVQVILDYGVEGKEGEENFDHACDEFIRVINYAVYATEYSFHECEGDRLCPFWFTGKIRCNDA